MSQDCILLVEADILVRSPLAEYLRECGYRVVEAGNPAEARQLLDNGLNAIDVIMIDIDGGDRAGFELAAWVRGNHAYCQVVLAGTPMKAAEKAGDLCHEGPALTKPYDHQFVLEHIRRTIAARAR
jgi:DNA-binding response OmpR family regulator